ncbi:ROK family transcriptional regulator [Gracilibacillus dipsosauri]|uniref:ROK family protein n=1 Tax=Gracilibacillus dipsosauri TaxID=178340 RepID=A0A317KU34_9BACI|nr:ROK family protein [Gracilibacillus dipsosauri]PWU66674.1 hypothetical protein DLJ74_19900 [Gracilibacillus dipsosauri]
MNETEKSLDKEILSSIRQVMFKNGSATKGELRDTLDISFPTISKFLSRMEKNEEVVSVGLDESSGGRRAKRYLYNHDCMLGLAIILERDKVNYLIFNCAGEVKEEGKGPSVLTDDGLSSLTTFIEEIITTHSSKIKSLAIGVPGSVNNDRIFYIPDYKSFQNVDLKGHFEDYFSLPVVIENDMNAAVLGFYYHRRMKDNRSLVYLNVSHNGQGAGFMINGDVVRGSTFFAGEISFVPQYSDRNFGQAFEKKASFGKKLIYENKQIDAISRLVASFVAIINPHTIIFCSDEMNQRLVKEINRISSTYIPSEHLPEIVMSNWRQDYLFGLRKLGLDLIMNRPI